MQIGGFYIIKHKSDCFCTSDDAKSRRNVKVLDCFKNIWSLAFLFKEDPSNNGGFFNDGNALGISSDVCLCIPANLKDLLQYNFMDSEGQGLTSAISDERVLSSPVAEAATASLCQSSESFISSCLFPEGNLTSLHGYVIGSHDIGSSFSNSCLGYTSLNAPQSRGPVGARSSICIHVSVDEHIVNANSIVLYIYLISLFENLFVMFYLIIR